MTGSVIPFPSVGPVLAPAIELVTVQRGATKITFGGVNDTYHGEVLLGSGEVHLAYLKDLDSSELGKELIVAWLAKSLGWPVPDTYLAKCDATFIPTLKAPIQADGTKLLLASRDAAVPSLKQFYHAGDPTVLDAICRMLSSWPGLGYLYGLDTWCANVDRNIGNILVGHAEAWLIDHGRSFTGPAWPPAAMDPGAEYENLIKDWLTPMIATGDRVSVADEAGNHARVPDNIIEASVTQSYADQILGPHDAAQVVDFLKSRRTHVRHLAARALHVLVA